MHCASCTALIEESLTEHPGVASAQVDLEAGEARVGFDPGLVGIDELGGLIVEAGYTASPVG
jgi:copper chaperone CopZ